MCKCKVLKCNNEAVKGSKFCENHKLFVDSYCGSCHAKIRIKSKNYEEDKTFYCRSCSSKMRIIEYNKSDASKEVRRKNMVRYNNSPEGKANREKGLKAIHANYTGSPKHLQQIRSLGLRHVKRDVNENTETQNTNNQE